ncbi:MAG: D-alanine--D-alanine ligase, partial [Phycisphaerae bacterium]
MGLRHDADATTDDKGLSVGACAGRATLRVTVLSGGPSDERAVSLASGAAIAAALRRRGHAVFESDIGPAQLEGLDSPADVVFPALHGTFGEDGTLQHILESRRIAFVGSGSTASALAMDKVASKARVMPLGVNTPPFLVVTRGTLAAGRDTAARHHAVRDALTGAGLAAPLVVKPVDSGSSVGTAIVRNADRVPGAVVEVVERFGRALVERFIEGDELTVGLLDGAPLPPICIRPKRAFYNYEAKYEADDTEYLFDAGHDAALLQQVQSQSRAIFLAFGCRHLARIDWMVDRAGRPWFLVVNSLPGFTSHSLVP